MARKAAAAGKGKAKSKAPEVPAVPYEPTDKEAAVMAAQQERTKARAPRPKMKTTVTTKTNAAGELVADARIEIDHVDGKTGHALLAASIGSTDWNFSRLMLSHLAGLSTPKETLEAGNSRDEAVLAGNLAIVQAVEPQNELECMLAVQMAAVHCATMHMACNMRQQTNTQQAEVLERSMNRLARTFTTQMEALKKHRNKGEQKVVVEHRHYHLAPGSQAVFGDVQAGGGVGVATKNGGQSHERNEPDAMRLSERPAMLGLVQADGVPVPRSCDDRQEGLSVPRREGRRAHGAG